MAICDILPVVSLVVWVPLSVIWALRFKAIMRNGYGFKIVGAAIVVQGLAMLCIAGSVLRLVTSDPYTGNLVGMTINVITGLVFAGYTFHRHKNGTEPLAYGFGGKQEKKQ